MHRASASQLPSLMAEHLRPSRFTTVLLEHYNPCFHLQPCDNTLTAFFIVVGAKTGSSVTKHCGYWSIIYTPIYQPPFTFCKTQLTNAEYFAGQKQQTAVDHVRVMLLTLLSEKKTPQDSLQTEDKAP